VLNLRQEKSRPILEKFKAWIDDLMPGTPPNSALSMSRLFDGVGIKLFDGVPGPGSRVL
jgi:hypothetical protein